MKTKFAIVACIAAASSILAVSPASAGGLSLFSGKNLGIGNGNDVVIGPSVNVGDVLSGNNVLNQALNGSLNNILSQNGGLLGLNILSGNGNISEGIRKALKQLT